MKIRPEMQLAFVDPRRLTMNQIVKLYIVSQGPKYYICKENKKREKLGMKKLEYTDMAQELQDLPIVKEYWGGKENNKL